MLRATCLLATVPLIAACETTSSQAHEFEGLAIQHVSIPDDVFTLRDEGFAFRVTGPAGAYEELPISLAPLFERFGLEQDAVLLEYGPGRLVEVPQLQQGPWIVAGIRSGSTYIVLLRPTGRALETYSLLCSLSVIGEREGLEGLLDKACQRILCAGELVPGTELLELEPRLAPFADELGLDELRIGGLERSIGVPTCDRCTKLVTPRVLVPDPKCYVRTACLQFSGRVTMIHDPHQMLGSIAVDEEVRGRVCYDHTDGAWAVRPGSPVSYIEYYERRPPLGESGIFAEFVDSGVKLIPGQDSLLRMSVWDGTPRPRSFDSVHVWQASGHFAMHLPTPPPKLGGLVHARFAVFDPSRTPITSLAIPPVSKLAEFPLADPLPGVFQITSIVPAWWVRVDVDSTLYLPFSHGGP